MTTKPTHQLSLKDKLSRLSYSQACKLLGPQGKRLLEQGGKYEIEPDDVHLDETAFRLQHNEGTVRISLTENARRRLLLTCGCGNGNCEHKGAALAYILDDKMGLGLAAPPPEQVPIEHLSETELIAQALELRWTRAKEEKMVVKSLQPDRPWTDYLVTNRGSGKTYRVALRGFELGDSYCNCPDFRKNTLGTCKHVLHTIDKVKTRFSKKSLKRPYRRTRITAMLKYGDRTELWLLVPNKLDNNAMALVQPFIDRPITDSRALLRTIERLETLGHEVTIHPDAEAYLQQRLTLDRIRSIAAQIRKNPQDHPLRNTLLKTELLPYQLDGIAFALGVGRSILADDMGLGKTIQGIGVAEFLARQHLAKRVLVICPASLKSQWRSEIERFSGKECQLILGRADERVGQYNSSAFFTLCNYEQVLRDIEVIECVKWDFIILDEGQRIKNWEAKTSRVIKGLRSPFALVLSGTPMENRLEELYSVVEFIDEKRLGPAFRFLNRHRILDEKGRVIGYKNLDALRNSLKPILLRRTRQTVMQQLPKRTTEFIRITPTEQQLNLHSASMQVVSAIVRKKYLTEMDLLRLRKALLSCRMAADSTYLVDKEPPGFSSKLERLEELFGQFKSEGDRKSVLFSEWTTMLDLIEPLLEKHDIRFVRLDGSVPQKKRQSLVNAFRNDPEIKFFITTNAGATGLNLQSANTVVNVDLPWNPAVLEQRIARIHRMGQKNPIQVFILISEETIEENLLNTLSAKLELSLAALDTTSEVDSLALQTGIDELRKRLEILLGAKPEAPLDAGRKKRLEQVASMSPEEKKISLAGGHLLSSALSFLSEMIPRAPEKKGRHPLAKVLEERLQECLKKDDKGRPTLTVTLPDTSAITQLASSLAYLLSQTPGDNGQRPDL